MKLPIKKIFFDKIKNGEKQFEYRDAHLTLICEETKEQLTFDIFGVTLVEKECLVKANMLTMEEKEILKDKKIIVFNLGELR